MFTTAQHWSTTWRSFVPDVLGAVLLDFDSLVCQVRVIHKIINTKLIKI